MPQGTLFQKLKRLFSTNVIVRNVGGRRLKVIDTMAIQKLGLAGPTDRFNRLYSGGGGLAGWGYDAAITFAAQRRTIFKDYEVMDNDSIIASSLDIYADESTLKNEMGDLIDIKCENEKVKSVLENLFYDILNIEFNLWPWIRNLTKYGDLFLNLEISEKFGITNVRPMSVYEVRREEGSDPENPDYVKFVIEGGYSVLGQGMGGQNKVARAEFENFQVAHFRLMSDTNYLPYGKSMLEGARRAWKQLTLLEDAMLIHRVMRAPEKRVFNIDIGNIPPNEVDAFMQKIISQIKKVPFIDPVTGDYNLKYNMMNLTEDFYLPVRGGDSGTSIDTLSGLEYTAIDDIEYLRNKMMAALKIPKAFIGYEESVGSKATLAAEDVRFARTIERIQKIVVSELTKIAIIHLFVQGFEDSDLVDFSLTLTNPSTIYEQEKIELWNSKIALARDIQDTDLLSSEWVYKNIFSMSTQDIEEERRAVVKDVKRKYRFEQISVEGNDPAVSGQGFNQQMAPRETGEKTEEMKMNLNFEDLEEVDEGHLDLDDGRRGKKSRTRKKDEPFGEDPLGQRDYANILKIDNTINHKYKGGSPLSRENVIGMVSRLETLMKDKFNKPALMTEDEKNKNKNGEFFLDESNILDFEE